MSNSDPAIAHSDALAHAEASPANMNAAHVHVPIDQQLQAIKLSEAGADKSSGIQTVPSMGQVKTCRTEIAMKPWSSKSAVERLMTLQMCQMPVLSLDTFVRSQR